MTFSDKIYSFDDIPEKRKYIAERVKKIFKLDDKDINDVLDSIKISFREQTARGASDHLKKTIYITTREIVRRDIHSEDDVKRYLMDPRSVIVHETMHIFQNIFKIYPDINYNKKDGEIDYSKYVTDEGEIQSRIENVIDLLNYGFGKEEIINLLYSRKHKDIDLWKFLVEKAAEIKKIGKSKLPPDQDEEDTNRLQNQQNGFWTRNRNDSGTNYEKDYISGGHFAPYDMTKDNTNFTLI